MWAPGTDSHMNRESTQILSPSGCGPPGTDSQMKGDLHRSSSTYRKETVEQRPLSKAVLWHENPTLGQGLQGGLRRKRSATSGPCRGGAATGDFSRGRGGQLETSASQAAAPRQ